MIKRQLLLLFLLFTLAVQAIAQVSCIPEKPNPPRLVNDFANVLSPSFESQLENYLIGFNDTTSTQIALITMSELCDEPYIIAHDILNKWGVGSTENNGVVVLFKPKTESSKGQIYIASGYGVEGVMPDAIGKRIVENEMIPYFKQGQTEKGLLEGILTITEITGGEYSAQNYNKNGRGKGGGKFPFAVIAALVVLVGLMFFKNVNRARNYAHTNNTSLWMALWLMGSMNSRHSGSFGNFTSGRGGFGRGGFGGGSGFGGFGGGMSGGGGAGGSW